MALTIYTEQDIQDYAAGIFEGNKPAFEEYLKANPEIHSLVKVYQQLYGFLKEEEVPVLSFNLADRVMAKIQDREVVKNSFPVLPLLIILSLSIIGILVVARYIHFIGDISSVIRQGLFILSVVIMIFFLTAFGYVEVKQMERRMKVQ